MEPATSFAPVSATTGAPVRLAMQRLWLSGHLLPAGARLTVQHLFRSEEEQPLEVIYSFPLPRDASLRAFRIKGDGFEAHSELKPVADAVREYEQGIAQGALSTLARQYADGIVNLTVGNIRPGETVTVLLELVAGVEMRDAGFRFRFPFTLAPLYHPRMKAAVTDTGEGELELTPDEFGDVILPGYRADASSLHQVGFELTLPRGPALEEIGSPSHAIRVRQDASGPARVTLAPERDVPNRDLVLDLTYRETAPQVLAGASEDGRRAFAAIVPSTAFGSTPNLPRRAVVLLDRSGSMSGAALTQARRAIEACLAALSAEDQFSIVAFDDRVECLHGSLLAGTRENREQARRFLAGIGARGGTELVQGFEKAAGILGGAGDVLILTDGQVAGADRILARARAAGIRMSCLGIGEASQDRLLAQLARETGGASRFVTPSERVDLAAVDLFASIGRPVATGLRASGGVAPEPSPVIYPGTPVLIFGDTPDGEAQVELAWSGGGRLSLPVPEGDTATGRTVRLLQGARLITDWESRYGTEESEGPRGRLRQRRVAERVRALSEAYGLSSREMALVAVVRRAGDRPGELPETRVVPVGMPRGVEFEAYFAAPGAGPVACLATPRRAAAPRCKFFLARVRPAEPAAFEAGEVSEAARDDLDLLFEIVSQLEPDGGMPGDAPEQRAARSVAALHALLSHGHTLGSGAFRSHVARLLDFLKSLAGLSRPGQEAVARAIRAVTTGLAPAGDWLEIARKRQVEWGDLPGGA